MLRHDWRRLGISAEEVQEFCVWRNAPMRVLSLQGDLVDSYDPALKEHRTVCFLAFDGHRPWRAPNDYILLRNGQRSLCASCKAAGKGFFRAGTGCR